MDPGLWTVISPAERTWPPLELRVYVPAPPARVWSALTEPELLVRWLARRASGRAVPAGTLWLGWDETCLECRVVQAVPQRTLRFSWPDPDGMLPETMVVVGLQPRGDGTLVELEHYGFGRGADWDLRYVQTALAWAGYLKNLKSVLGGGPDLREDDE